MKETTRILSYFSILFILLCGFSGIKSNKSEVPQLNNRLEIFVDYYLIDKLTNTLIVKHTPRDEGPVFYFDKPWEGLF